ncbi:hypothetical protein [[Clostridium] scindens]|uniref:hypothetical protein n=1 Tax=Clostridium scindens (strain JCM 10418 / VPI 12708) TaxID=29347 RepID=UPI0034A44838
MGRIYDAFVNFFCSLSDGWMGLADRAQDRCGQAPLSRPCAGFFLGLAASF